MTTAGAQSPPPDDAATRTVEVPGAGATVTLPRAWRTWSVQLLESGPGVSTTDVDTGWTCQISATDEAASAQAAGDAFSQIPEPPMAPYEASVTGPFEVATRSAVGVTLGSPERDPAWRIEHLVYVDAPQSVVRIYCGSAPIDHGLDVARTIAPLTAGFSPEPFDPRVEVAAHGVAVDFGV